MDKPAKLDDRPVTPEKQKRVYATPRLVEYGNVAKLTTGGSGPGSEGMSGMAGMN